MIKKLLTSCNELTKIPSDAAEAYFNTTDKLLDNGERLFALLRTTVDD